MGFLKFKFYIIKKIVITLIGPHWPFSVGDIVVGGGGEKVLWAVAAQRGKTAPTINCAIRPKQYCQNSTDNSNLDHLQNYFTLTINRNQLFAVTLD